MAGTQRWSLPRQTKLIESEFTPRHVWGRTKQPDTLKTTLLTKQYCENVSKLQLYGIMKGILPLRYLSILIFCKCVIIVCSQPRDGQEYRNLNCQKKSTSGRDYVGEADITVDGIPCQRWSDTEPHDHKFIHVGDHNFCRNPIGASESQVWCYTSDPEHKKENCSVPFCSSLKALDFSQTR